MTVDETRDANSLAPSMSTRPAELGLQMLCSIFPNVEGDGDAIQDSANKTARLV
jgi:hypothetical protein